MKRSLLLLIALVLPGVNSFAQSEMLNPVPIQYRLSAVNFIDANTGYATGDGGTILKTSNGGTTWISQSSGTTNDLYAASFPDGNTYYAAGSAGLVVKTSNGGTTWQNFTPGSTAGISSTFFVDPDTGFVTNGNDGNAVKTTDGGATWNQCLQTGQVLYSVYFMDVHTGFVSGTNGLIQKTTDGGLTWNNQVSGTTEVLFSVYGFDESAAYAVGSNGTIVHTSDGGANWFAQASGISQRLMGVRFTDVNTGYAVGDYGKIIMTEDGGDTWNALPSGTTVDLYSVCFTDADTGYVVGGGWGTGIILKTTDGGLTWNNQSQVQGHIINVPADYPTIQQGINAANFGDTVLVQPGTYLENINFNGKRIIVASLFLTTQDDAYISQTIIDGNDTGSVVRFENYEDANSILCGFTLTNGHSEAGGGIYCYYSSPELQQLIITHNSSEYGGGIYCGYYSYPYLQNLTIKDNSAVYSGGGICSSYANPVFDTLNRCNIFLNSASTGSDLYIYGHLEFGIIKVVVDTFSVLHPTYYYANPVYGFSFDILNGKVDQFDADLYVSPGGDDANSGLTESDPLKTIRHAFQIIYADSLNPHVVNLLPGTYSPSTSGEIFPVNALDYVTISGESESNVILDAEGSSRGININGCKSVKIINLTITGGYADNGGGIYCSYSNPDLQHLSIINNSSMYNGGGIWLDNSDMDMQNITINNNSSNYGGGINCTGYSHPYLENVTITNNAAAYAGGGIYFNNSIPVFDSLNRCNIYFNNAPSGHDLYNNSYYMDVVLDTFTVLIPKSIYAYPLENFHFDILHGMLPQENITLYISPEGDNANTGLTIDDPFKTIQFALSVVNEDSLDTYTLHLLNGIYSPSSNGEVFPLDIPECVHLEGESESGVILDAEGLSRLINLTYSASVEISDLTIINGNSDDNGGGIYCYYSNPDLRNLSIKNNIAAYSGGGIYFEYSHPILENLSIKNNVASLSLGGGIFFTSSSPVFDSLSRCDIYFNNSINGNDLYSDSYLEVIVDTFTVLIPKSFHAYPLANFSFDILHGLLPQENVDLFVSPDGNNTNSGLTAGDPLKTIQFALSSVVADSLNFYTLHILNGIYSASTNGEVFPLNIPEYLKVAGESETGVILDAEGLSRVIGLWGSRNVEISNLTITGGNDYGGGGIYCSGSSPDLHDLRIIGNYGNNGGGIYLDYNTSPKLTDLFIANNASQAGGGIFCSSSNPHLKNLTIRNNAAEYSGGGIFFSYSSPVFDSVNRCNIYYNNAATGSDLHADIYPDAIDVIVDTFSVMYPTAFHASPLQNFSFDILNGKTVQAEADLFVSPDGDNSNTGLTENDPLKTIYCAYAKMLADSLHPHTVNLLAGTYSPSTNGEIFPVNTLDFVNITGESESGVILDAEGLSRVISKINYQPTIISDLTVTGGHVSDDGGGIYCANSNLKLQNVSIINNSAGNGGGLCCSYASPTLENVKITNNSAIYSGGGLYCNYGSSPSLQNVTISDNSAGNEGGGIYNASSNLVFDTTNRCNIYLNNATTGRDLYSETYMKVVVDTFSILNPKPFYAMPFNNFSFDILHGMVSLVNADVYVSPGGDDANSGLDADNPLKTIQYATAIIAEDSQHLNTIRLLNGTYSTSTNGETFPLYIPEFISLSGESETGVILDANGQSRVFEFKDNQTTRLSDLTITGGFTTDNGGGIYSKNSSLDLLNLTLHNNSAIQSGGGICLDNSGGVINNVTVSNNAANYGGGGIYCTHSSPVMQNVALITNSAGYFGGGMFCTGESNTVLENVAISGNTATYRGGGICSNSSDHRMKNVNISDNSGNSGGGFYCAGANNDLVNVIISNNSSVTEGGGIYSGNSRFKIVNGSIVDNQAVDGGGIYCYSSDLEFWNSILWNESVYEVFFRGSNNSSNALFSFSDIRGGEAGIYTNNNGTDTLLEGNIDGDPLFISTGDYPYSLPEDSPCRNTGTPDTTGLFLPPNDLAGNPRVWDDRVDMGAYEWSNVGTIEPAVVSRQSSVVSYPNPFISSTTFEYVLEESGMVTLEIFNQVGQLEIVLVNEQQTGGNHQAIWNADRMPAGIYFYSLRSGKQAETGKMIILK